jgi:hypothetical protein
MIEGTSPMDIACVKGNNEIVELMLKHGSKNRPLRKSIQSGNAKVVKLIVGAGIKERGGGGGGG